MILPESFYKQYANILNEKCIANKDLNTNFYRREKWTDDTVKNQRVYCYSILYERYYTWDICPECKHNLSQLSSIDQDKEYQKIVKEIEILETKLADIAINRIKDKENGTDTKW